MPAVIAAPWLGTAIAGVAGGASAIAGAKIQSGAANRGTKASMQANDQALAFQREQADREARTAEADRRANYDQWAATQRHRNAVLAKYGLMQNEIPAYVSGMDAGPPPPAPRPQPGPMAAPMPAPRPQQMPPQIGQPRPQMPPPSPMASRPTDRSIASYARQRGY